MTAGAPVYYRNGYPDFEPFACKKVFILGGEMKGTKVDFTVADRILARVEGWSESEARASEARAETRTDASTMALEPTEPATSGEE